MIGKFIVFEGIDGSGKSTQTKLLIERLKKKRYKVVLLDFPQYGKKSAGLVEEYLSGKYGSAKEVNPFAASVFYAVDRYDASFYIRKLLSRGFIIIADRYVPSNMGHQGGKILSPVERKKFFRWLYELEYGTFGIPKPTKTFLLHMPPRIAQELCRDKERRKKKKEDIHEKDINHLMSAAKVYHEIGELFPREFTVIECTKHGKLLPPEQIHEQIWKKIAKLI